MKTIGKNPTPPHGGPDEDTIRLERELFRRRRRWSRLARLKPLLLIVGLVLLLGVGGYVVGFTGAFGVRQVEVRGVTFVTADEVRSAARIPAGRPLARVDVSAAQSRVEEIAGVQAVQVSRAWPNTIRVDVTERTPVAVVPVGSRFRALDATGVLFRTWDERPAGLPLIESDGAQRQALGEAARVVGSLPPDLLRRVEHVSVRTVEDIQLVMRNGRIVLWGSAQQSTEKAAVFAELAKRPSAQIDVRVPSRPSTKS